MALYIVQTGFFPVGVPGGSLNFDLVTATGPTGPIGTRGAQGIQGPAGAQGLQGISGAIGPANDPAQTPAAKSALALKDNLIDNGIDIYYTPSIRTFTLVTSGHYEVSYHTVATNAASVTLPVSVGVSLASNKIPIPGTTSMATIRQAHDVTTLSATTFVTVAAPPHSITLETENGNGMFTNTSVLICRLD